LGEIVIENKARCVHYHTQAEHPNCFDRKGYPKELWHKEARIGFLDIESTNLNANFGFMLSWFIKTCGLNEYYSYKTKSSDIKNLRFDKQSVTLLTKAIRHYDIICTYYGSRFDIPMVRTIALVNNVEFPVFGQIYHLDLYYAVRHRLKLYSNRLEVACHTFGIEGKTHLDPAIWRKAAVGDQDSIDYIYDHNKGDVDILEQLYYKLLPYIKVNKRSL
jgi:uncharacterized protein YprB with RNaseH-like and TPR domain